MPIPKIIHQTWKTHDLPEHWKESQISWKALETQGWVYRYWTDEDMDAFMAEHYPWFLEKFRGYKKGINRADAWRYFVLHREGGVYADLDLVCKVGEFLAFYEMVKEHQVVLPRTKEGNGVNSQDMSNCFLMSQPGVAFWPHVWHLLQHPYSKYPFKAILAKMTPYFRTIFTTGPGLISDAVHTYPHRDHMYLAPAALVQPGDDRKPKPHDSPEAVVKVIEGSSWHPKDARFWQNFQWFKRHSEKVLCGLLGIFMAVIIGLSIWIHFLRKKAI